MVMARGMHGRPVSALVFLQYTHLCYQPCLFRSRTIQTIVKLLIRQNIYVVYYNSRGVGKSTGRASFTGRQEGEDLQELVQQFLHHEPHITSVIILVRPYFPLNAFHASSLYRVILMAR